MYLNLYQIMGRLSRSHEIIFCREKRAFDICQVKLFSSGMQSIRPDVLYLVCEQKSPEDLPDQEHLRVSEHLFGQAHVLLCKDTEDQEKFSEARSLTVISGEEEYLAVFDELQDIFVQYQKWESDIIPAILEGKSLQAVLDRCAVLLEYPIALFDLQQNLLMKSGDIQENPDELWSFVLEHGRSPEEGKNAKAFNQRFARSKEPFYYTSAENYTGIRRLVAPLYSGESVFGCLAAHDPANRHLEREFADFCMIQKYMNHAIAGSTEYHFAAQGIPWYITQLLQGNQPDRQVLDYNLRRYDHWVEEAYFLWNFQEEPAEKSGEEPLARLLPNITYALQTNMVFLYEGNLLAIDYQPEEHWGGQFKTSLDNLMMQNGLCGGRSMVFYDITELATALQQSRIALDAAKPGEIADYIEKYPDYVLRAVASQKESGGVTWPGLERLLEKDPEYGKELLICLKNYILFGRNMSVTAKLLYIHRHTVLYRIQKIESFLNIRIDALEEKELVLLYLACCILLEKS